MPTTNKRGHVIPTGAETSVNRATIFETYGNSIRDVVPVASVTARTQLVSDLSGVGQAPSATKPLYVWRADAPGLHRIEATSDGTVWVPASGVLQFASTGARDTWTTANGGLLTHGDVCWVGSASFVYWGSQWDPTTPTAFTPTYSGITIGASTHASFWWRDGGTIQVESALVLGTGWNISGPVRMSPPVAFTSPADTPLGDAFYVDAGTGYAEGRVFRSSALIAFQFRVAGAALLSEITNTVPFAFTVGDAIRSRFEYRG